MHNRDRIGRSARALFGTLLMAAMLGGCALSGRDLEQLAESRKAPAGQPQQILPDVQMDSAQIALGDADLQQVSSLAANRGSGEARVKYYRKQIELEPHNIGNYRGFASALFQADRYEDSARAWEAVVDHPDATDTDRFTLVKALARAKRWDDAAARISTLNERMDWTTKQHLYAGVVYDNISDWGAADASYAAAAAKAPRSAAVLNNWGVSKLARGATDDAESLFYKALQADPGFNMAKVNFALTRALKGDFDLPALSLDEVERAYLLHDVGVIALRRGQPEVARKLFQEAIDSHPQHYKNAVDKLAQLEQ